MKSEKRKRLEAAGWRVGTAAEFLELSPEEAVYVELKLRLSDALRERRKAHKVSQQVFAAKLGSSQSRVAKMEASDPSVSLDLLIRGLIATGASRAELGRIMGFEEPKPMVLGDTANLREAVAPGVHKITDVADNSGGLPIGSNILESTYSVR